MLLPILLLAAALRCFRLGAHGLWLDEAVSWRFAEGSFAAIVRWLQLDSGPPLYYFLLHLWIRLVGDGEVALRALSALLGTALVALLYFAGRRLFGAPTALFAALLLAVLPIQVRYGQEARSYALLALLGLGAMFALLLWVEEGKARWLALHGGLFAALLYTHNYGFFLLAAGAAFAALEGWRRGRPWRSLAGLPLAVVLYLPWLPTFFAQLGNKGPYAWMGLAWEERGLAGSLADSLRALSPGGGGGLYVGLPGAAWGGWATLLCSALAAWGLVRAGRWWKFGPGPQATGGLAPRGTAPWLFAYLLLPPLLAGLYSALRDPIYLPGRLDQLVVPAFCLALAVGLQGLRPELLRAGAVALFALASLLALRPLLLGRPAAAERELARAVEEGLGGGAGAVVATGLTWAPLSYALRARPEIEVHAFPAEVAAHPGNLDLEAALAAPARLEADAETLLARLAPAPGERRRVALAFVPDRANAVLLDRLRGHPGLLGVQDLGDYPQRLLGQPVKLFLLELGSP